MDFVCNERQTFAAAADSDFVAVDKDPPWVFEGRVERVVVLACSLLVLDDSDKHMAVVDEQHRVS